MRTTLTYTLSRLILFVVVLLVLDLAGARGLLLIALALLVSGLLSYLLLSRQRDAMARALSGRLRGRDRSNSFRARLAAGARSEDADDERAAPGPEDAENQPAAPSASAPASENQ